MARLDVPLDAEPRPVVELRQHRLPRRERLQAERVAGEVGHGRVAAAGPRRDRERLAEAGIAVVGLERALLRAAGRGDAHAPPAGAGTGRPRNWRAVPPSTSRSASGSRPRERMSAPGSVSPSGNG